MTSSNTIPKSRYLHYSRAFQLYCQIYMHATRKKQAGLINFLCPSARLYRTVCQLYCAFWEIWSYLRYWTRIDLCACLYRGTCLGFLYPVPLRASPIHTTLSVVICPWASAQSSLHAHCSQRYALWCCNEFCEQSPVINASTDAVRLNHWRKCFRLKASCCSETH